MPTFLTTKDSYSYPKPIREIESRPWLC